MLQLLRADGVLIALSCTTLRKQNGVCSESLTKGPTSFLVRRSEGRSRCGTIFRVGEELRRSQREKLSLSVLNRNSFTLGFRQGLRGTKCMMFSSSTPNKESFLQSVTMHGNYEYVFVVCKNKVQFFRTLPPPPHTHTKLRYVNRALERLCPNLNSLMTTKIIIAPVARILAQIRSWSPQKRQTQAPSKRNKPANAEVALHLSVQSDDLTFSLLFSDCL